MTEIEPEEDEAAPTAGSFQVLAIEIVVYSALVAAYRNIYLSRRIDDKEIQLKRQNKIFFQINGVGHEALGAAIAERTRKTGAARR